MKKFSTVLMVILLISLSTTSVFANTESANMTTGIPKSVLEKADSKVTSNKDEIPEIKAWETDLSGNTIEVTPKSMQLNSKDPVSVFAPPKDGYVYLFNSYISSSAKKNWYYENLGTFRFSNQTSTPIKNVKYEQTISKTSKWSVSSNISGEAKIGNSFLGQIKAKLGAEGAYSRSWTKGNTYGASYTVPARTIYYLTNYQVGLNSNGKLLYNKYHPSGGSAGVYTESAGGTAVSKSDISIEVTASEPIR